MDRWPPGAQNEYVLVIGGIRLESVFTVVWKLDVFLNLLTVYIFFPNWIKNKTVKDTDRHPDKWLIWVTCKECIDVNGAIGICTYMKFDYGLKIIYTVCVCVSVTWFSWATWTSRTIGSPRERWHWCEWTEKFLKHTDYDRWWPQIIYEWVLIQVYTTPRKNHSEHTFTSFR